MKSFIISFALAAQFSAIANTNQSTCDIRVEFNQKGYQYFSLYKDDQRIYFSKDADNTVQKMKQVTRLLCHQEAPDCTWVNYPNENSLTLIAKSQKYGNQFTEVFRSTNDSQSISEIGQYAQSLGLCKSISNFVLDLEENGQSNIFITRAYDKKYFEIRSSTFIKE